MSGSLEATQILPGNFQTLTVQSGNFTQAPPHAPLESNPLSLTIDTATNNVEEASSSNFTATLNWDDSNSNPLTDSEIGFSASAPYITLAAGELHFSTIYQDETVNADFSAHSALESLVFNIENRFPHNFAPFHGNGLPDDWEILHFGISGTGYNGPNIDDDGDGYITADEYVYGTIPTVGFSRLSVTITAVNDNMLITIEPAFVDRDYRVEQFDLSQPSIPGTDVTPLNDTLEADGSGGLRRKIEIAEAIENSGFYRVRVSLGE